MPTLERLNTDIGSRKRENKGNWQKLGGAARRFLAGRNKSRSNTLINGGNKDGIVSHTVSSVGLTEKERARFMTKQSAEVEVFSRPEPAPCNRQWCERCEERRTKLARLQREIDRMRHIIINDDIVTLEVPPGTGVTPEVLELAQESAKLRITIDSLMRFQVRLLLGVFGALFLTLLAREVFRNC